MENTDTWKRRESSLSTSDSVYEKYWGTTGPEKYRDAPVCLQLVTRRYREEVLLAMVERIVHDLDQAKWRAKPKI